MIFCDYFLSSLLITKIPMSLHVKEGLEKVMMNIFPSGDIMLKEEQKDAVESFILGRDTFVSLPTGIGKSLIYQLIVPLTHELLTQRQTTKFPRKLPTNPMLLVVAPLQALVNEQLTSCEQLGLKAEKLECLDSEPNVFEKFDILFTSPETLERQYITIRHPQDRFVGVVIDESHCVVNW